MKPFYGIAYNKLPPGMVQEPGITGMFTRNQAPGAFPNGSRVVKCDAEPTDVTPLGAQGTVIGSIAGPVLKRGVERKGIMYWISWDWRPTWYIAVSDWKLEQVNEAQHTN